jgi:hypothetical protein
METRITTVHHRRRTDTHHCRPVHPEFLFAIPEKDLEVPVCDNVYKDAPASASRSLDTWE